MAFDMSSLGIALPEGWSYKRVGDVALINADTIKKKDAPHEIYYIDISSVSSGSLETPKYMLYADAPSRAKRRVKKNDFIISTVRPNLKQYVFLDEVGSNWVASTGFCVVSANDENYAWYLYSVITSNYFNEHLVRVADGAAYPAFNPKEIEDAVIFWPDEDSLKSINDLAKNLNRKIIVNSETNQTLEQIAQAIFKSWFVDFEPVRTKIAVLEAGGTAEQAELAAMSAISAKDEATLKQLQADQPEAYAELEQTAALFPAAMEESEHGEIPNGWKYEPVINSAEYINGAAYKNMHFSNAPDAKPVIKIAELKNGITDNTKFTNTELGEKFKLNTRDILFSWSGSPETSIDTFIWTGGEAWLNQHIFKVVNDTEEERCFTYWLLKFLQPTFIDIAKNKQTTGLGHVTRKDMERLHYCKPNDEAMSLFFKSAGTILSKIENNLIENLILAESRDELLPKLLSGDLPITNTEVA